MKIFVIGCGSIGERHIRNLIKLGNKDITAIDIDSHRLEYLKGEYRISADSLSNLPHLLKKSKDKISLITLPNHLHIKIASLCAEFGSHIFIEKPLSHTNEGIALLERTIKNKKLISMVACNMRFYPAIKYVKECLENKMLERVLFAEVEFGFYLPYWRPSKDYRKNYGARKEEGGGVILDLYHEFDYIYWFFGMPKRVVCMYTKASNLEINTEDNADVVMEYSNDGHFLCNMHLDYLQYKYERSLKVVGEKGMLIWRFQDKAVTFIDNKGKEKQVISFPNYEMNEMYVEEMKYFLNCIRKNKLPMTNIKEAKQIQSAIFKAKDSARKKRILSI